MNIWYVGSTVFKEYIFLVGNKCQLQEGIRYTYLVELKLTTILIDMITISENSKFNIDYDHWSC